MATFKKGQSMKAQRVHVTGAYEQKSPLTGMNVAFSLSNDDKVPGENASADPMLVYDTFEKDGEKRPTYTAEYSKKQWEAIAAAANKDGDDMVVIADLFPKGKGLVVNTNSLQTPENPFNREKHKEVTLAERDIRKAAREAKAAAKADEKEQGVDKDKEQALEA